MARRCRRSRPRALSLAVAVALAAPLAAAPPAVAQADDPASWPTVLAGRAFLPDGGTPAPGATVSLALGPDTVPFAAATTGADGRFTIDPPETPALVSAAVANARRLPVTWAMEAAYEPDVYQAMTGTSASGGCKVPVLDSGGDDPDPIATPSPGPVPGDGNPADDFEGAGDLPLPDTGTVIDSINETVARVPGLLRGGETNAAGCDGLPVFLRQTGEVVLALVGPIVDTAGGVVAGAADTADQLVSDPPFFHPDGPVDIVPYLILLTTADDLVPHPARPCPDVENGCDRTWIDPADPDFCHWEWGTEEDPEATVPCAIADNRTTNSFARDTSRGSFTAINFNSVRAYDGGPMPEGGNVGVDINLAPQGQPGYRPCGNAADPYNGACMNPGNPGSYVYAKNWYAGTSTSPDRTNFGAGLFMGNSSSRSSCPYPCTHYWGQRVQRIDIELYPVKPTGGTDVNYVRPRFAQFKEHFIYHANSGTYGPPVGQIRLPTIYNAGIARLAGFATRNGVSVGAGEFEVRMFEIGAKGISTNGQALQSFATAKNNTNGYYNTGALYADYYRITLIDYTTGRCRRFRNRSVPAGGQRLDFNLDRADFGHPDSVPC